jgi:hypothetical protein
MDGYPDAAMVVDITYDKIKYVICKVYLKHHRVMLLEKWEGGRGGSRIPSIDLENSFPPTQI